MEPKTIFSIISLSIIIICGIWSAIINRRTLKKLDDNFEKLKKLKGWE